VAVADDDVLFGEGLRALLAADPEFVFVGHSAVTGLTQLVETETPDVLLVDSRMPGAVALCAQMRHCGGPRPILLCAPSDDEHWAAQALEAGARGILCRQTSPATLGKAIRTVHEGQIWASHGVLSRVVEDAAVEREHRDGLRRDVADRLSGRERQVLGHASRGLSNKEIGGRLGISPATVKAHLTRVFQKLGLRDRVQLAANYNGASIGSAAETGSPPPVGQTAGRRGPGS
jgi:DNA-binding NarL/FixJ family response regulator